MHINVAAVEVCSGRINNICNKQTFINSPSLMHGKLGPIIEYELKVSLEDLKCRQSEWANETRLVAFRSFPRRTHLRRNIPNSKLSRSPHALYDPRLFWSDISPGSILSEILSVQCCRRPLFTTSLLPAVALYTPSSDIE